jgi:hypothetical protein
MELRSVVQSFEDTQRRLDVKARLARRIAEQRLGWRPRLVGVILVVEDTTTNRRRLASIEPLVRAGLPATSRQVRRWLSEPAGPLRGIWFVPLDAGLTGRRRLGRSRVRISGRGRPSVSRGADRRPAGR